LFSFIKVGVPVRAQPKSLRVFAATALVGLAMAAVAAAAPSVRIDNFGRINANYYRGAQPEGQDYNDLAALGVKTIIDLTSDDSQASEPQMTERAGMQYVRIPMTGHTPPTQAQITQFFSVVNDPASQPVYVHCVGGKHRTGIMTAIYRMTNDGWSADQAFSEMKQFKFGADFLHAEFKRAVFAYPAQLARKPALNADAAGVDATRAVKQ
jgi:tyrosine-protein phosphatase SIW14